MTAMSSTALPIYDLIRVMKMPLGKFVSGNILPDFERVPVVTSRLVQ